MNDAIEKKISRMNISEKIGQLLMVGVSGQKPDDVVFHRMNNQKIASFLLFQKNTPNAEKTRALTHELHAMAKKRDLDPLLIAIDQEHGRVTRINQGVTILPAAYGLGRLNHPEYVYTACKISGTELNSLGINVNFAPVADVNTNPANPIIGTRSYGEEPESVARMVKGAIKGYRDAGMICAAKHFPGHGDVSVDSHLELPICDKTIKELYQAELIPFESSIAESVPMIMTAHVLFPQIDSKWPATLSPVFLTQILRSQLQYNGVIISDDLEMKALNQYGRIPDLAVQMIVAGCDMLIISENLSHEVSVDEIYVALTHAVQQEIISEHRLDQSVKRILKLRQMHRDDSKYSPDLCSHSDHQQISQKMMKEIFYENPHSSHFPRTVTNNSLVLSDVSTVLDKIKQTCSLVQTQMLDDRFSKNELQHLLADKSEIFIFLSQTKWLSRFHEIRYSNNQSIHFFSLNNPYIQSKIQFPLTSYINLYAACLPLSVFNLIFSVA